MLVAEYKNRQNDLIEIQKGKNFIKKINRNTGKSVLYSGLYGQKLYDHINSIITDDGPVRSLKYYAPFPLKYVPGVPVYYFDYTSCPEYNRETQMWSGEIFTTDDKEKKNPVGACGGATLEEFWKNLKAKVDKISDKRADGT